MKKLFSKNESGRSMVEMLGVLAIIGVLSVGGIAGYKMAMEKNKANEFLNAWNFIKLDFVSWADSLPQCEGDYGNYKHKSGEFEGVSYYLASYRDSMYCFKGNNGCSTIDLTLPYELTPAMCKIIIPQLLDDFVSKKDLLKNYIFWTLMASSSSNTQLDMGFVDSRPSDAEIETFCDEISSKSISFYGPC